MSRRPGVDIAIAGGGVVGAACALVLAALDLRVALVEPMEPAPWSPESPDLRVYAFAPDNAALFDRIGLWHEVEASRAQPYRRMRVWDAAGGGELVFDADAFGRTELGWIVEHGLLVDRLWNAMLKAGVQLNCPARVEALDRHAQGVRLRLDDGSRIDARLVIAADGAGSTVRTLAGLDVATHDYAQRGVVAYVRTEHAHEATAWQRFLPGGPLAVLPCTEGRSSIVWTLPDAEAHRLISADEDSFNLELTRAFDQRVGAMQLDSERAAFPLRRQLANGYVRDCVIAIGDAAHVVHPLAGQGVNLGLRDVRHCAMPSAMAQERAASTSRAPAPFALGPDAQERERRGSARVRGTEPAFFQRRRRGLVAAGAAAGIAGRIPALPHLCGAGSGTVKTPAWLSVGAASAASSLTRRDSSR